MADQVAGDRAPAPDAAEIMDPKATYERPVGEQWTDNEGQTWVQSGTGPVKAALGDAAAAPDYSGYSPALQGALQKYTRGELSKDVGIGVGLQALESATLAIPTEMDRHNKQQLRDLERRRDEGQLGLSGDERALLERGAMAPVQAQAAETRMRSEAAAAASGGASVADLTRAAREADRTVATQARQAGMDIEQTHLQREQQQLRELEQRKAARGERQAEMLKAAGEIPAGVAPVAGQVRAARAVPMPNIETLKAEGWADDDIAILLEEINQANFLPPALRGYLADGGDLEPEQKAYFDALLGHGEVAATQMD